MKPPFLRTAYNYDMNEAGDESGLKCKDKTLTQQHFREETDINTIVDRFLKTSEMPTDIRAPQYGDFTGIFDFHSAMNAVAQANEAFDAMPARVRARFHNNPSEFVDFCSNDENKGELGKMGLLSPEAWAAMQATKPPVESKAPDSTPPNDPPASDAPKASV